MAAIHILAIPFFLKGHEIPLLHLCRHLKSLSTREIIVTILRLPQSLGSYESSSTPPQDLEFVRYENLPVEAPPELNINVFLGFFDKFKRIGSDVAAQWRYRGVTCVIADVLISWGKDVATELCVPWIAFWTSTMTELAVYANIPKLISGNAIKDAGETISIPGLGELKVADYTTLKHFADPNFRARFIVDSFVEAVQFTTGADRVLVNSAQLLEENAVKSLKMCDINVVPVGPLHLNAITDDHNHPDPNQVMPWLDDQKPRSVLYIAFGTIAPIPRAQFQQIALALESLHDTPFLWVVRRDQLELIPSELAHTARYALKSASVARHASSTEVCRGILTDWVPQVGVLRHRAVGGFFTHCGWNSVMEGIAASVPMISMPRMADQVLTSKLLEDWGVSVRLGNAMTSVVSAAQLEVAIRELMSGRQQELRDSCAKLGALVKQAMEAGGSSRFNLQGLSSYLTDL